jgi:hypothetical protein
MRFVLLLLFAASAPLHAAEDFYAETFGRAKAEGGACFTRTYDASHLAKHPRQKVRFIALDMVPENADGRGNSAEDFQLGVGVEVKGGKERYLRQAYCKASASAAECFLEADGGRITIKPADGGRLRLEVGSYGLSFEASDFLQIGADESDDNVFILDRAAVADCAGNNVE